MTETPMTPRPAATVMLLRDTSVGLKVFLLQRHSGMEFAPGTTVFPGGGVDDRDRNADLDWTGPEPAWWGHRMGVDEDLALALVCTAARETFEECGVLLAGPADGGTAIVGDASVYHGARAELASRALSFSDFLRRERLVLRADLLRPWANWVTPAKGHRRRYDTYFFVAALPHGQHADGQTSEAAAAGWATPAAAIEDFTAGRSFLLPPTWTQLDTLTQFGGTVDEILAVEREIVAMHTEVIGTEGNWSIDFFDSERYERARRGRPWS
ncbi:NUDIX hydrolase [Mycobacterium sp.]|uniref:NUDIX hydrolase n=1 Tax=Mycobacterium sp. TaxID=1785 RepID=UPI002D570871|nr:NUDIX hydrolase [Mycobacterium sp.]HZA10593.1 NUDIX hydrolase [Mycobacterium sp.]